MSATLSSKLAKLAGWLSLNTDVVGDVNSLETVKTVWLHFETFYSLDLSFVCTKLLLRHLPQDQDFFQPVISGTALQCFQFCPRGTLETWSNSKQTA